MDSEAVNSIIKDKNLLQEAFTHRSYLNETKDPIASNERLEFLGDAVLEIIVSEYLFHKYPEYPEGKLTLIRASIVRTETLAQAAKKLNLGSYLRLSKGEEENDGRNNQSILANTYEAYLGALYIDQGLQVVKTFITQTLFPFIPQILEKKTYRDAKSYLQEIVQERDKVTPEYKVIEEHGPDHAKTFTVGVYVHNEQIGKGSGKSKQYAEAAAAKKALLKYDKVETDTSF